MDDLVGLILFAIIGGVAWLANKIKETKENEAAKPPAVSREDLPERTRQMLYGGEVKTAKPKQGQSFQPQHQRATPPAAPPAPREAAPRQLPPLAPRRTVVAKRPAAPPVAVPEELSPRELQQLREQQAQPHAHEPGHDLAPHELRALRQEQEVAQPLTRSPRQVKEAREQQQLVEQRRRVLEQARQLEQKGQQPSAAPRRQAPVAASASAEVRRRRWLDNAADARRGIVLGEILGPPKAFQ